MWVLAGWSVGGVADPGGAADCAGVYEQLPHLGAGKHHPSAALEYVCLTCSCPGGS